MDTLIKKFMALFLRQRVTLDLLIRQVILILYKQLNGLIQLLHIRVNLVMMEVAVLLIDIMVEHIQLLSLMYLMQTMVLKLKILK
ncbi:hypothetical protein D3C85_1082210 [compost metagenome]